MVVAEVTLTVVLLVGAGLFVASFLRLVQVDVGFDYRRVLTVALSPSADDRTWTIRSAATVTDIINRVRNLNGVEAAAAIANGLPFAGLRHRVAVRVPTDSEAAGVADAIELRGVSSDYFETLRIPIQRGRAFTDSDRADAPLVVVLSQEASRKLRRRRRCPRGFDHD